MKLHDLRDLARFNPQGFVITRKRPKRKQTYYELSHINGSSAYVSRRGDSARQFKTLEAAVNLLESEGITEMLILTE